MRRGFLILVLLAAIPLYPQEGSLSAESHHETNRFAHDCTGRDMAAVLSCGEDVFTERPVHIVAGNLAPQNGFAAGAAFVYHFQKERWGLTLDTSALASGNASWRAGLYIQAIYLGQPSISVVRSGEKISSKNQLRPALTPIFNAFVQASSLNKIGFFGLGPGTSAMSRSFFAMRETIVGSNVVLPVVRNLRASLMGEINGRLVDIGGSQNTGSPSIEQVNSEITAPGLTTQPGFLQLGEGGRIQPSFLFDRVQLDYQLKLQEFLAVGNSKYSFNRFTLDLSHSYSLYRAMVDRTSSVHRRLVRSKPRDEYTPDAVCSTDPNKGCKGREPPKKKGKDQGEEKEEYTDDEPLDRPVWSLRHNPTGAIGLRVLLMESMTSSGSVVPFYFQPTMGGSDINGNQLLGSYQDYRFRARNLFLLRGTIEHSIWGPVGFTFLVDEGKVAMRRSDVDFQHLAHSFATGLTFRIGQIPQISLSFAWGGKEGTHTSAVMNTSLLGSTTGPSLH